MISTDRGITSGITTGGKLSGLRSLACYFCYIYVTGNMLYILCQLVLSRLRARTYYRAQLSRRNTNIQKPFPPDMKNDHRHMFYRGVIRKGSKALMVAVAEYEYDMRGKLATYGVFTDN